MRKLLAECGGILLLPCQRKCQACGKGPRDIHELSRPVVTVYGPLGSVVICRGCLQSLFAQAFGEGPEL